MGGETENPGEILTTEEVARYLKISVQSAQKLDIPKMQKDAIIRYKKTDVDEWFDSHKGAGA